jgi:hypothetical protein
VTILLATWRVRIRKRKNTLITKWEVQNQSKKVRILPQNRKMIIRQKLLCPNLIVLESQFLWEKFFAFDPAENFIIDVPHALESILTFLDFCLLWLERYTNYGLIRQHLKAPTLLHMSMPKKFIQKEHPCKKLKSNEKRVCPILPDFVHIGFWMNGFWIFVPL